MDRTDLLQVGIEAARIGGEILQDWSNRFTPREKSPANLVTEADLASEKAIYEHIVARFPDHRFLGEEGLNKNEGDSPYRWIIDPLDGTSNYVHKFPYYAVSIGLECNEELIVGVILDPNRDEVFTAIQGEGAFLNEQPIQVSVRDRLSEAMCMASLPVKTDRDNVAVRRFLDILEEAQTVQRTGSAALNLCAVASGRIDAFWSTSLQPWDMAAGVLIATEAGGSVTTCENGNFSVHVQNLLATNGTELHTELSQRLQKNE
jgi:myo-inositol-1(or 4)-monophosphatase